MIRALLIAFAFVRVAHADVVTLPNTKATLDLPPTWTRVEATGVVLGAKGPAGEVLAITRAQVPNPDAWRTKKREAYLDAIERGVAGKIKGYKRVSRKYSEVETIPTLELEAKRDDGATIVIRMLLYRTFALSLAIEIPKKLPTKEARAILTSFSPPPATPPPNP